VVQRAERAGGDQHPVCRQQFANRVDLGASAPRAPGASSKERAAGSSRSAWPASFWPEPGGPTRSTFGSQHRHRVQLGSVAPADGISLGTGTCSGAGMPEQPPPGAPFSPLDAAPGGGSVSHGVSRFQERSGAIVPSWSGGSGAHTFLQRVLRRRLQRHRSSLGPRGGKGFLAQHGASEPLARCPSAD
jgi:hypothetical protein